MTDDEFKRAPIAAAPLSVLLLAAEPGPEVDSAVAGWVGYLRELNRTFEIIVVREAVVAEQTTEVPAGQLGENEMVPCCDPPEKSTPSQPLTLRFFEVRTVPSAGSGLGALMRAGLAEAVHPLVLCTLANLQYKPAGLPKLLEVIDDLDLVTGIRTGRKIPLWLKTVDFCVGTFCAILFGLPLEQRQAWLGWGGLGRRLLANWFFGVAVHDPECTFCLVRRDLLKRMVIQSDGSFAAVEFLAKANFFNALMGEVPVAFAGNFTRPVEEPGFLQQAIALFRQPDFGPAFLPANSPGCGSVAVASRAP